MEQLPERNLGISVENYRRHETTNDEYRIVDFASSKNMEILSTVFLDKREHINNLRSF